MLQWRVISEVCDLRHYQDLCYNENYIPQMKNCYCTRDNACEIHLAITVPKNGHDNVSIVYIFRELSL